MQFVVVMAHSGLETGCASGAAPGHIATWVCPGEGCQTFVCARTSPNANTAQRARIKDFILISFNRKRFYSCRAECQCTRCLTKKAEPPPTRGVNRDSGTDRANGGWLRRLVRHLGFKFEVRQPWRVKYHQLSTEERHEIAAMRRQSLRVVAMAQHLGRHRSTLYREVKRNQSANDGRYRATHAVEKAGGRQRRSRRNLRYGQAEFGPIEVMIREELSPEQIVGRSQRAGQRVMSHETIYRWIWRDKRCGGTLWRHLRGARKRRRKRYGRYDSRSEERRVGKE